MAPAGIHRLTCAAIDSFWFEGADVPDPQKPTDAGQPVQAAVPDATAASGGKSDIEAATAAVRATTVAKPKPASEPTPGADPKPAAEPAPVADPKPAAEPTPVADPKPAAEPTPVDGPKPAAEPTPVDGLKPAAGSEP